MYYRGKWKGGTSVFITTMQLCLWQGLAQVTQVVVDLAVCMHKTMPVKCS